MVELTGVVDCGPAEQAASYRIIHLPEALLLLRDAFCCFCLDIGGRFLLELESISASFEIVGALLGAGMLLLSAVPL